MKISLRQFQLKASQYLKSLEKEDIVLTQYNIPVAKVTLWDEVAQYATEHGPEESSLGKIITGKELPCDMDFCKNSTTNSYKVKKYNKDTGENINIEMNLCKKHYNSAKAEGVIYEG